MRLGAKKRSKKTRKRRSSISTYLTAFFTLIVLSIFWLSKSVTEAHLPEANQPPELYANQVHDDLRQVLLTGINDAKESILLIIYTLTDDKILHGLRQKSEEGVHVSVICDAKACPHVGRKLGKKVHLIKRSPSGLMHQKILVVDNMRVWIGSANMTSASLQLHANLITAFHSPLLASVIKEKAKHMRPSKSTLTFNHQEFSIGGQNVELWFFPDDPDGVRKLKRLIDTAQKTVRVAMFTWTRDDLANAVIQAKKRGVQTEVVIDGHSGQGVSAKIVKLLKDGGIPVRLSQGNDLLHHKFLYIDGKTLVNGSANWTKAAFTKNDDCFIILHDLTKTQQKTLNNLWDAMLFESVAQ